MTRPRTDTFLIITQVFIPDPASVGQHLADVAREMARRGHRVLVYAANRGYEDPSVKYPRRETIDGVEIRRLSMMWFGKKSLVLRALATAVFHLQILLRAVWVRRLSGVLFSTSPPLIGLVATMVARLRRVPAAYWAMDLNPDQLIAMGRIPPAGRVARVLEWGHRKILRRAARVIVLDRFMADRLTPRVPLEGKLRVAPPWPHEQAIEPVEHADNPFRRKHGLDGRFVVMYSGNHSPANPLDTLLAAAVRLKDDDSIRFLFVGGGLAKKDVEAAVREHNLKNVISLPYQPLAELRYSLSAADVHVVTLGEAMAGIVHPCKIYGAMAVGRPILYFGPRPSHVTDLLEKHGIGWRVGHGDVAGAVDAVRRISTLGKDELRAKGGTAAAVLQEQLSQSRLCGQFCDWLEEMLALTPETR